MGLESEHRAQMAPVSWAISSTCWGQCLGQSLSDLSCWEAWNQPCTKKGKTQESSNSVNVNVWQGESGIAKTAQEVSEMMVNSSALLFPWETPASYTEKGKYNFNQKSCGGVVKRCVSRLNQTQTICNGDNIRNKKEMFKMKRESDQKTLME